MSKPLVTFFLLVGLPLLYLSRFEPHSDCLRENHVVLADGEWFPMENFRFCSIYLLAMTLESEIILTTCHKTPKTSNVLYRCSIHKDYTHYNADS